MEDQEVAKKKDSSEQVLIERDGKFELVSVSDMEANDSGANGSGSKDVVLPSDSPAHTKPPPSPAATQGESLGSDSARETKNKVSVETNLVSAKDKGFGERGDGVDQSHEVDESTHVTKGDNLNKAPSQVKTDKTANVEHPIKNIPEGNKTVSPKKSSSPSCEHKTSDHVSIAEAEHIHHPRVSTGASPKQAKPNQEKFADMPATASATALQQPRKIKRMASVGRTKSAPGLRLQAREQEEEEREKRQRNEAAFTAWLAKKDKEIAEQKQQEMLKHKNEAGELEQKRSRNEAAFKAWLTYKNEQIHEDKGREKITRPATSVPKENEERNRTAFKTWLNRKQDEQQCVIELRQRQHQEEEEVAKKVDPTTVEKAYKRWLHRKNVQAREEAVRKEQYRKHYFSQSRRTKHSLARFEGF